MSVASNHESNHGSNHGSKQSEKDEFEDEEWEWDEDTDVLKDITNAETLFAQSQSQKIPTSVRPQSLIISHQQVQNRVTEISEQPVRKRRSNDSSSNNLEGKARILFGI